MESCRAVNPDFADTVVISMKCSGCTGRDGSCGMLVRALMNNFENIQPNLLLPQVAEET